ncbi:hypothetical protein A3K93_06690 [Acinetobacter sp. NCu2D-2]|uniref:hypothetical protein n=1 Tax=Acinetobacter sp. NCu2D-2 TaxID=1608473 RepID=UPI0007CE0589|nr:hypothetical protein [Acinetobacter sp. NCu2D-2]ANF81907.1 hypothetical protein A3K93_06690 [Acinetobacter sp. NCu2D-2]
MSKMIDVLEQQVVQNFSQAFFHSSDLVAEQLKNSVLNASEAKLKDAIAAFFKTFNANEAAQVLEIPTERIGDMQNGVALKDESGLVDTLKVVTLCLAMETNLIEKIEVSDCVKDFPM